MGAACVALFASACGRPALPQVGAAPVVSIAEPVARDIVEWDEYICRLESPQTVELRARVNGYLDAIHFKEGGEVKKGDLLFSIDPRPYRAQSQRADADAERAAAQTQLAKNDYERAKGLVQSSAISREDFDTKAKTYAAAEAAVRSARAAADLARLDLEFTQIHSPIDGRISRALVTEGNLVSGGVSGAGATLLTTIVSLDPLYCYGDADERAILKYIRLSREGKRESARDMPIAAEMELDDETDFPHKGVIDFLDNRLDPSTGTMRARAVFANEDRRLSPGFFVRMRIPGSGRYSALLIPDRAIGSDQSQKFLYVVGAKNAVERRPVETGPLVDGLRVVRTGIAPAERVIVDGLLRVRPGVVADPQPLKTP